MKAEDKLMKPKLIWKGTLGEARKHPLYDIGFKEGKAEARKEFIELIDEVLKWRTHKVVNGRLPKQRIKDFTEGYDSAYEVWINKIKELKEKLKQELGENE